MHGVCAQAVVHHPYSTNGLHSTGQVLRAAVGRGITGYRRGQ